MPPTGEVNSPLRHQTVPLPTIHLTGRQRHCSMNNVHTTDMRMPRTRTTRRKTSNRSPGKERITVSLSKEKVRFLKAHRGQKGAPSVSAYVERLVAGAQARAELEKLSAHTALYYDSLSAKEAKELSAWGGLGESALAPEEE